MVIILSDKPSIFSARRLPNNNDNCFPFEYKASSFKRNRFVCDIDLSFYTGILFLSNPNWLIKGIRDLRKGLSSEPNL